MYDPDFMPSTRRLKRRIVSGDSVTPRELDNHRSRWPYIFNVETTNACNMKCGFCPRSKMTRKIHHIDAALYRRVIEQARVPERDGLDNLARYASSVYDVMPGDHTEDAFYFAVSSRFLTMHGYGDPLLDPYIVERVRFATGCKVPSYLSCVPVNAKPTKIRQLMQAGLGVLKFSLDSMDEETAHRLRGPRNDVTQSLVNIEQAIGLKKRDGFETQIVVTMVDAGQGETESFRQHWSGQPVLAYVKSMDNRWHAQGEAPQNRSHYERQYCEYPWTSLTVLSNGAVVPCPQDYDGEMVMGNAYEQSLEEIWNSSEYAKLREAHFTGKGAYKCFGRCDQKVVADWRA